MKDLASLSSVSADLFLPVSQDVANAEPWSEKAKPDHDLEYNDHDLPFKDIYLMNNDDVVDSSSGDDAVPIYPYLPQ